MRREQIEGLDSRAQSALDELRTVIQDRYPKARFEVSRAHDEPENIHLTAIVDVEDPDEVLDLVVDRVLELQVDEGVPVHVIPIRTPERVLAEMKSDAGMRRARPRRAPLLSKVNLIDR
jgi:hypothetical protein